MQGGNLDEGVKKVAVRSAEKDRTSTCAFADRSTSPVLYKDSDGSHSLLPRLE